VASDVKENTSIQLGTAVNLLTFSEKDLNEKLKKLKSLIPKLNKLQKALSNLEQKKLGIDSALLPISLRLDRLVLRSNILDIQVQQVALKLEVEIEEGIDDEGIKLPSLAGNEWKDYEYKPQELDKNFKSVFHVLVIQEQEMSSKERSRAWEKMQEARSKIDVIFKRVLDVKFLKNTHSSIAQSQVAWWPWLVGSVENFLIEVKSLTEGIWSYPLFNINNQPLTLLDLTWFFLVIFVAFIISRVMRRSLIKLSEKRVNISESAMFNVGRILQYLIITAAILIGFSVLGIDISKLALFAGALSVGIGFGMQSIFNNFLSGLILLLERPLKVGDLVMLESGIRGRIRSINVRSTQLTTWDNVDILVPNSEFISGRVTNYTFDNDLRRIHVLFGVAYGTDKNEVKKAVIEAALRVNFTVKTKGHCPDVWLVEMGESSLNFELVVWVRGGQVARGENPDAIYLWEIEDSLREKNIKVPFPQHDIHVAFKSRGDLDALKVGDSSSDVDRSKSRE
jgi:small-conductance mechanosensitive channel